MPASGRCLALLPGGDVCLADAITGLHYCRDHASIRGLNRALITKAVRRAMCNSDRYLAATLAEWPDEDLAAAIAADPARIWLLRLAGWPRLEHWAADLDKLAAVASADAYLLGAFLQERGIIGA
jgi:hypothetical protein